jgi:hypothetical protein
MRAVGADLAAVQVGKPVDSGIGVDHELMVDLVDRLPEIDPAIAAGTVSIGRHVISSHEFDLARGHRAVCLVRGNVTVVIDVEAVLFPRPGFNNDVQQRQMAARPIRE